MKKMMSKLRMGEIIIFLGIISIVFTLILSAVGAVSLRLSNGNTKNIYEYYEWSNQIDDMKESILQIALSVENASHEIDDHNIDIIEKQKDNFMQGYNDFTSTESDENEEKVLASILSNYNKYIELTDKVVNRNAEDTLLIVDGSGDERKELQQVICDNLNELEEYVKSYAAEEYISSNSRCAKLELTNIISILLYAVIFMGTILFASKKLKQEMEKLTGLLGEIADGNLDTKIVSMGSRNEISTIKDSVNEIVNNFSNIIRGLQDKSNDIDNKSEKLMLVSEELVTSINNVHTAIGDVSKGTSEQATDMLEVSSILNSFSEKIDNFAENIEFLNDNSNDINVKANLSNEKMNELIQSFDYIKQAIEGFMQKFVDLNATIDEIGSISNLINEISEQTNLLALNAAIESARVGEAGKGFAVVAEEIGKLADESKKSANNINSLINNIAQESQKIMNDGDNVKKEMNSSLSVIDEAVDSFKNIINSIDEIVPKIDLLNKSSEEISSEKDVIYQKIENSTAISEEISASCEEVSASVIEMKEGSGIVAETANNLSNLTNEMNEDIKVFKI